MSQPRRAPFTEELAHLPTQRLQVVPQQSLQIARADARRRALRVAYMTGWKSGLASGLLWGLCAGLGLFWLLVVMPTVWGRAAS